MQKLRVLLVEDEPLILKVYRSILNDITREKEWISFNVSEYTVFEDAQNSILHSVNENKKYDLALLDIRLTNKSGKKGEYGKQLGQTFRKVSPNTKLMVITSLSENFLYYQISKKINPEGFMVKTEIGYETLKFDILLILQNKIAYSKSIVDFLRNEASNNLPMDEIDRKIIHLLYRGIPLKDIPNFVSLSFSGVERRKRRLAQLLQLRDSSIQTLIEAAKDLNIV